MRHLGWLALLLALVTLAAVPTTATAVGYVPDGSRTILVSGTPAPGGIVFVEFAGAYFEPGEGVAFTVAGTGLATLALMRADAAVLVKSANDSGAVSLRVTLPQDAAGSYGVTGSGLSSGIVGTAVLTVPPADAGAAAAPDESAAPAGAAVTAAGLPLSDVDAPVASLSGVGEQGAAAVPPLITVEPPGSAAVPGSPAGAANPRDQPGAPTVLSGGLVPILEVFSNPVAVGGAALAGLMFVVLGALPTQLLAAAIKERVQRRAAVSRRPAPGWWAAIVAWFGVRPVIAAAGLILAASLIQALADPGFGFDLATLRLILACLIAAFVIGFGSVGVVALIARRHWGVPAMIAMRPWALLLTVAGIVLSRLIDFAPGILFGLMIGISFPPGVAAAHRAAVRLLRTGIVIGAALLSWVGYSILIAVAPTPDGFQGALLRDSLAALSTEGLVGMLIAMLPFLFLDGRDIWAHSRRRWAVSYVAVVAVFVLVVVPQPNSWAQLGEHGTPWLISLTVFAAVVVAGYLVLHRGARQPSSALAPSQDSESTNA